MSKKLLVLGLILAWLTACGGRHDSTALIPSAAPLTPHSMLLSTTQHYLYAEAQCATSANPHCIDTFQYNATAHTLHLLRRLVIPANATSFDVDRNGDIVVSAGQGVFYYHHDDYSYARPFRSVYLPRGGGIAIGANDTLWVARTVDSDGNGQVNGYHNASTLTSIDRPDFRHTCTIDPYREGISFCGGTVAADGFDNVFEIVQCGGRGDQCILGWKPADAEPSYTSGDSCAGSGCNSGFNSMTFDLNNYMVINSWISGPFSPGNTTIYSAPILSPPTRAEPGMNISITNSPNNGASPYVTGTDDGVGTAFTTKLYGQSTTGQPYQEIAILDFNGNLLGSFKNVAAQFLLYK